MNKGVQILLERMESNPDEFADNRHLLGVTPKWESYLRQIEQRYQAIIKNPNFDTHWQYALDFLDDEEIIALHNKLKALRADEFTRDIMARLLADADDGNYHTSAQADSGTPKNIYASQNNIKAMQALHQKQIYDQQLQAQQEMMLTQANLADAIQNINAKRAFGKGK